MGMDIAPVVLLITILCLAAVAVHYTRVISRDDTGRARINVIHFLLIFYLITSLFNRITVDVGFSLSLFEITSVVVLLFVFFQFLLRRRGGSLDLMLPSQYMWVFCFIVYVFFGLVIGSLMAPSYELGNAPFSNDRLFRPVIQGVSFFSIFALAILCYGLARLDGVRTSFLLLRVFYSGVILLLVIALVQFFLGILDYDYWFLIPTTERHAFIHPRDDFTGLLRLSSWAGEPRTFGNTLLLLFPVWLSSGYNIREKIVPLKKLALAWGPVAFLLTFSASSVVSFILLLGMSFVWLRSRMRLLAKLLVVGFATLVLGAAILQSLGETDGEPGYTRFTGLFHRVGQSLEAILEAGNQGDKKPVNVAGFNVFLADNEQPVLGLLVDNPTILIFGSGWGNTTFFAREYMDEYLGAGSAKKNQQVLRPNMSLLRFVSDIGLVGMSILIWGIFKIALKAKLLYRTHPQESQFFGSCVLVVVTSLVIFPGSYSPFVFLMLIAAHLDNRFSELSSPKDDRIIDNEFPAVGKI